ncbi:MAG: hypothetical protein M3R54_07445, partial [Chloroflexota bacterium]|nr:hypothetical protein [Chloroflexota bacterium]
SRRAPLPRRLRRSIVLPALTVRRRIAPSRRLVLVAGSAALTLAAVLASLNGATSAAPAPRLADQLRPATWAMNIPAAWLASPTPPLRVGDTIDVLAIRTGDKGYVLPVAYGVMVLGVSERGLVLEVDETDASAIATARGGGMLLVALLRSTR